MIRLSIPLRQTLARLSLPVLVTAAFGMMLLGKADSIIAERLQMVLADALAPIYGVMAGPLRVAREGARDVVRVFDLEAENRRLRAENATLRRWQSVALALDAENATLKANLHWIPDPRPSFVTARVVADAGGVYARAALLSTGPSSGLVKGQIAIDDRGLVGRITELGARSVRVLLITDLNSRIPVALEGSHARAIMAGTNGPLPRLMFWPEGVRPVEGERVVTSAETGAFPAGLPVGQVQYSSTNVAEVLPYAELDHLEVVRLLDYSAPDPVPAESGTPASWPSASRRGGEASGPATTARITPVLPSGPMPTDYAVPGRFRDDQ